MERSHDKRSLDGALAAEAPVRATSPVFVASGEHRDRVVKVTVAGFLALATLWVAAIAAGLLGFRSLPELPLVPDPPADAPSPTPTRDAAPDGHAGRPAPAVPSPVAHPAQEANPRTTTTPSGFTAAPTAGAAPVQETSGTAGDGDTQAPAAAAAPGQGTAGEHAATEAGPAFAVPARSVERPEPGARRAPRAEGAASSAPR